MADDFTPPNNQPPAPSEHMVASANGEKPDDPIQMMSRIKKHYADGVGAFEENRRMHSEDLNFVYNAESQGQWDPVVLEARRGKPCYTFNRVIGPVNLVVADMRQTRPTGKVRPNSEAASEAVAEVLGGLIRCIEKQSRAEAVYKLQYKFAVAGGFGAWRLSPEYAAPDTFDQVLRIRGIANPQTVIWDPECNDPCAGDAMWCIVGDRISKDKHKALFPGKSSDATSFDISRDSYGWFTTDEVRVVEYFERVPYEKEIAQMSDGTVIDWTPEAKAADDHLEAQGLRKDRVLRMTRIRKVLTWRVMWVKCNGNEVLEGPEFYNWQRVPVVRVPGRYINIEGRKKLQSLVRHSKDAQRSYNSRTSDMIERSALIPKAPYLVTERMVEGYENEWAQANTASRPYLPYNVDKAAEAAGGMPTRSQPIDMPAGAIALAQQAAGDIQATTGFFDPALGNADDMNRVSGKALVQHTRRSDLGSFEFIDGYGDALQLTYEMAVDMIPSIYDAERVERIVGLDDTEKVVTLNGQQQGTEDLINDLKLGSYTVEVTIGPSYQSARQEALATLIDASETVPSIGQYAPDLIAKNLDTPDAAELTRRLRIPLIQAKIIQPTEEEKKTLPPPPQPDPMAVATLQKTQAQAKREAARAQEATDRLADDPMIKTEKVQKVAGIHLDNLLKARDLGDSSAETQAEASANGQELQQNAAEGAQDLHRSALEGAQGLQQQDNEHTSQLRRDEERHAAEMRRDEERHAADKRRADEKHAQAMRHAAAITAARPKNPKR